MRNSTRGIAIECGRVVAQNNVRSETVVQKFRPRRRRIADRVGQAKCFLHQFGPVDFRFAHHRGEQIKFRESAEERENHRLDCQVMSFRAEGVTPGFKEMRCRQIPPTQRRCLIFVITEPDYVGHLFLKLGPIDPGLA